MKAIEASRRTAREREREREREGIDPPTGTSYFLFLFLCFFTLFIGVITIVFTDVQGSTAQWEAFPEIMTIALDIHFKIMREHMNRAGGYLLFLLLFLFLPLTKG